MGQHMTLLHRSTPAAAGYQPIVTQDNSPVKLIEFGLVTLNNGGHWIAHSSDQETVLMILGGRCSVRCRQAQWAELGQRKNVFDGKATAVYLPPGEECEVTGLGPVEIAVCRAPADSGPPPTVVLPAQVQVRDVGADNWRRDVNNVVVHQVEANKLLIGETYNPPGNWSSYPPHKHDVDELPDESKLEEVYHYRLDPPQGFGLQRLYSADGSLDETLTIQDRDSVAIPYGYHPIVAAPGYELYYLWILSGETRVMSPRDDPEHTWMKSGPRD